MKHYWTITVHITFFRARINSGDNRLTRTHTHTHSHVLFYVFCLLYSLQLSLNIAICLFVLSLISRHVYLMQITKLQPFIVDFYTTQMSSMCVRTFIIKTEFLIQFGIIYDKMFLLNDLCVNSNIWITHQRLRCSDDFHPSLYRLYMYDKYPRSAIPPYKKIRNNHDCANLE